MREITTTEMDEVNGGESTTGAMMMLGGTLALIGGAVIGFLGAPAVGVIVGIGGTAAAGLVYAYDYAKGLAPSGGDVGIGGGNGGAGHAVTGALSVGGGGAGGSGSGSCVHVDSRLPDGRRAGDIKVGDVIQLGDESTAKLETRVGMVTYSKTKMARGFRIVTQAGIGLLCSDTAPIWTDQGFVLAPDLRGKKVATRTDGKDIVTRFETVEVLSDEGMIEVQHITVGDRAFWAGAEHGAYILHHNKYVGLDDEY